MGRHRVNTPFNNGSDKLNKHQWGGPGQQKQEGEKGEGPYEGKCGHRRSGGEGKIKEVRGRGQSAEREKKKLGEKKEKGQADTLYRDLRLREGAAANAPALHLRKPQQANGGGFQLGWAERIINWVYVLVIAEKSRVASEPPAHQGKKKTGRRVEREAVFLKLPALGGKATTRGW